MYVCLSVGLCAFVLSKLPTSGCCIERALHVFVLCIVLISLPPAQRPLLFFTKHSSTTSHGFTNVTYTVVHKIKR